MKISRECIKAYRMQYPEGACYFHEPDGILHVDNGSKSYKIPDNETDELFLDRLERSKKAGRNLFYEEWLEDADEYKDDAYH